MVGLTDRDTRVWAALGPTNTGKTHLAVERMLAHPSGMIGLPLRLLAREVYDRIVRQKGAGLVALVTGEERIVPLTARYFVATVEAMPMDRPVSFLAVDEIQLAGDPDRGHVFTDRLLKARGQAETMFLGSETIRPLIKALIPGIFIERRERFSQLTYTGSKKITKLARRSAIVAFSADEVYAIAELIRRHKGGAAVVMGAMSPRTRNAQVGLYQSGEVDFLVATDAIGMGLNMDVDHVAFASLSKFDGRRMRPLRADEIAQIAGRAGRYTSDGTFGETVDCADLDDETIGRVESHQFEPLDGLEWRSSNHDFSSTEALVASMDVAPPHPALRRSRGAVDEEVLRRLAAIDWIGEQARGPRGVKRLWDLCQLPDFRKAPQEEHVRLIEGLAQFALKANGKVPSDWFGRRVGELDRTDGDIEQLQNRLAAIRTWTYVANRSDWVEDNLGWQQATRVVEDRLSDTLHERLMQRFIDRRTSALLKGLKREDAMDVVVSETGQVSVEGHLVGRLVALRFEADPSATGLEERAVKNAAFTALQPELAKRLGALAEAGINEFILADDGRILWRGEEVGRLMARQPLLKPRATLSGGELGPQDAQTRAGERLDAWLAEIVARDLAPLLAIAAASEGDTLKGIARGIAYRVAEAGGVMDRADLEIDLRQLNQDDRKALRTAGLRFGRANIYVPAMLKPKPARLHAVLAFFARGPEMGESVFLPPPGLTSFTLSRPATARDLAIVGFRAFGQRAVRLDIVDRIADALFDAADAAKGPCLFPPQIVSLLGASNEEAEAVVEALGWEKTLGPAPAPKSVSVAEVTPIKPDEATTDPVAADEPGVEPEASSEPPPEDIAKDMAPEPSEIPAVEAPGTEAEAEAGVAPETQLEVDADAAPDPDAAAEATTEQEPVLVTLWRRKRAPRPEFRRPDNRRPEQNRFNANRGPRPSESRASQPGQAPGAPRAPRPDGPRSDGPREQRRGDAGGRPAGQGQDRKRFEGGDRGRGHAGNKPYDKKRFEGSQGRSFSAAPPAREARIDPDSPFAVLAALKVASPPPPPPSSSKKKHKPNKAKARPGEPTTDQITEQVGEHEAGPAPSDTASE
jgi:ATP-dependent RNA helicase SUPV3L1/SUV3